MNILFVNYGDLNSNSMNHIAAFANQLCRDGASCIVAIDTEERKSKSCLPSPLYSIYRHKDLHEDSFKLFPNSQKADIIHAWTPRENVREFCEAYQRKFGKTRIIVHLEDNEDSILENVYQTSIDRLRFPLPDDQEPQWKPRLSHPTRYRRFLARANAVTTLAPTLSKLLPHPKPTLYLKPPLELPQSTEIDDSKNVRDKFGIPMTKKLIVFPGGVTSNYREDLRSLYIAVKLLNDRKIETLLIKTGPSCPDLVRSFEFPIEEISIDLGFVSKNQLLELVSIADLLVQPGLDNEFNRDRFPSKIPELLASGRPCILPSIYKYAIPPESECCLYLDKSSPEEIADRCIDVLNDETLAQQLGSAAITFANSAFDTPNLTKQLQKFYLSTIEKSLQTTHSEAELDLSYRNKFLDTRSALKRVENDVVSLNAELRDIEERRALLERENAQLIQENHEYQSKAVRLQSTFSWKLTAPLRFLRRKFLDPLRPRPPGTNTPESDAESEPSKSSDPPPEHPCHHRGYLQYTRIHQREIEAYLDEFEFKLQGLELKPKISILLPVYNVEEKWLRQCIESVFEQVYSNWELCISDDSSPEPHIKSTLEEYKTKSDKIKIIYREKNGHISASSNSAFEISNGEYIALLDHDDVLPRHALAFVVDAINQTPNAKLIYSDEDIIDEDGIRSDPHFKSDWNYDFLMGCNMISHLGVYHRETFEKVGGFREGFEGAQDWDLALRVSEEIDESEIVHIPEVLYHWRRIKGSTALGLDEKDYAYLAQKKTLESHLDRIGAKAHIEFTRGVNWRVVYELPEAKPKIEIIIPTKDRVDLIRPCIESILTKTGYENYQITIIDNGSSSKSTKIFLKHISEDPRVQVIRISGEFNYSRINNQAILQSNAELICLLNNDTEVIDGNWLREMTRHATRQEIGVVGAKLLYPHDHVQHCGVIMGIYDIAGHAFKFLHKDDDGHVGRAKLVSGYSAVTGACMLFKKSHWSLIGGLDEDHLPISYNDIDFCLRLNERGFRTILTPFAQLYHKESESRNEARSDEEVLQFESESSYMRKRWANVIAKDPFYNKNFDHFREDFSYRI